MRTEAVDFLLPARGAAAATAAAGAGDFGAWLAQSLARTNQDIVAADAELQRLAAGEAQSLHQVMIQLEEARLGLQLAVQVRNRLLEAYQEVLRMQI
jgi:flagellar hook-basal body complex protein FliE